MKSGEKKLVIVVGLLVAMLATAIVSPAQSHEGFMYGKIYTSRNTYTGPIRWGKEEVFWSDLFNAAKTDESYEKLVPEKKSTENSWFDYNWNFGSIWENASIHQFTCQFGNMKEMVMTKRSTATIKLKNGGEIEVDDDGNDMGESIQIIDDDLGEMSIDWDNINRIEFLPTPKKLNQTFGMPLYGTVEGSRREKYTGFIVWDNDERLSTDKLDGEGDDGDVSIRMGDITSIERRGRGVDVKTKSGREMYLTGSNDVNEDIRGILVVVPEIGIVEFSWESFRKITFTSPPNSGLTYADYKSPKFMMGTVVPFDGRNVSGRIIYDIDEALDFEIIEGEENSIKYYIPLKNIKKITPKNSDYSDIELSSGLTLLLGDGRDVGDGNAGVLVFVSGKKEPVYIRWRQVDHITFD
jgi:hypothetical protein